MSNAASNGEGKMSLTAKVIVGLVAGILLGLTINILGLNPAGGFVDTYITNGLFHVVGKMFVNALKMLVVPLVLFSLICGVCGIGDIKMLGRVGSKSFGLYILTTAIAIAVAITVAVISGIGSGMDMATESAFSGREAPPLSQVLIDIIPNNPINALSEGEMLQIIFFAILMGVCILMVGKPAKKLVELIEVLNEVMMKMVTVIMEIAPYAVFCLIAKAMANLGLALFAQLIGYVVVLIAVLMLHLFVVIPFILKLFSGLSVTTFLKKARNMQVFAFSTASSNATIPVTLRTVTERLGVRNSVGSFTVPFGATINMDGTAIMQGVATVFIANIYGVELGLAGYVTVIMMAVLASIGTAGVPGVGLIMLSMVFAQVGLPLEGIGLILGVDRLLDMVRTAVNVTGDAAVSCIVAKSEGKLDESIFNDPKAGVVAGVDIDHDAEKELADVAKG
ncbi:sodium:dicarboxylate symporter [Enterovibrio norvegicus]|uniref:dicarboxylate/amino acid:cation symporter n=1 Tax=Enterovibrio norvegicus TaxID=188144 RepID=UPI0002F205CF|nr:dicarboxylate/amino acid:cation symporter [Enterovibrio norvegicus]MCC4796640.1 dicarboxylate/amino acid:cation symporter [Enterovibrio norvegicus]OEF64834.1 sodium:dicarboxylate symporter [Enterovibrio norvegicus]PMH65801.1 sodium:dicarboxylate symporter [Enterovibrio norvegicus]PMI26132.1 sodium:dicarboxylate symporter [Enterovibrio norvegicus]PMI35845.1 sodium:dicarboxylate symporter [Enterovibrio norvegicus]